MLIEVYSDVVCPWCYVGERRLRKALFERPDLAVERRWRPFQLQPEMPPGGLSWREFAVERFGGQERARAAFDTVSAAGAPDGIDFRFDRVANAPNTADAHRLILHAAEKGLEWAMAEALFRAYFSEGRDLNDHEELAAVASGVGLHGREVRGFLEGEEVADEVWRSQSQARRLGISGVPFYVVDERYALPGAQPVEVFLRALDTIRAEKAS
jgi:predicted DsbA family dithiol-disulfide isomerase